MICLIIVSLLIRVAAAEDAAFLTDMSLIAVGIFLLCDIKILELILERVL